MTLGDLIPWQDKPSLVRSTPEGKTMKIVGTNVRWVRQTVCTRCKILVEYEDGDVKSRVREHEHGRTSTCSFVPCPQCGEEMGADRTVRLFDPC